MKTAFLGIRSNDEISYRRLGAFDTLKPIFILIVLTLFSIQFCKVASTQSATNIMMRVRPSIIEINTETVVAVYFVEADTGVPVEANQFRPPVFSGFNLTVISGPNLNLDGNRWEAILKAGSVGTIVVESQHISSSFFLQARIDVAQFPLEPKEPYSPIRLLSTNISAFIFLISVGTVGLVLSLFLYKSSHKEKEEHCS